MDTHASHQTLIPALCVTPGVLALAMLTGVVHPELGGGAALCAALFGGMAAIALAQAPRKPPAQVVVKVTASGAGKPQPKQNLKQAA
ncbi:MAG: hypothetical protein JSR77_08845 [Planctomycetes bacterium]|nr:hypothetical protein [Planctomycetota bacterium]